MFKRRNDFLMSMDIEVNYTELEQWAKEEGIDLETAREAGLKSIIGHIEKAAKDAVRGAGQKWKGSGVEMGADGEPRFEVRFQGEAPGATTAYEQWCEKAQLQNGTRRILMARLRGSDGTDVAYMDDVLQKEYEAQYDELPKETQDMIDELMDPDAPRG